jgi:hypothetical protein
MAAIDQYIERIADENLKVGVILNARVHNL